MKKRIILAGFMAIAMTGCMDKFLTVYPETELSLDTFFKTEADFKQAVNGAYAPLRALANNTAWKLMELHSDNAYYGRNTLFGAVDATQDLANFAVPTANGVTANDNVLQHYRQSYLIISRCNQILTLIDGVDFNEDSKKNLKGQALFLRAHAYFDLVRLFGKVPLHLVPVSNRQEAALPLATTEELYKQIESDAILASELLLDKTKQEAGRVTSGSAKTLLANLYLIKGDWAAAETQAKSVITSGGYSLIPEYADAFSTSTTNKNNSESVFEVQFLEGSAGFAGGFIYAFLPRPMKSAELAPITGTSNPQDLSEEGNNIPTPDLIAAYEDNDKREAATIAYVTLSQSSRDNKVYPYIKKYAKPHAQHGNTGINWPIYRYAEVLLFMAEALNEQGKPGEAATYLNQVRTRAGLANTTATSQADMKVAIQKERRVELAFENKRWFDLVRTGTSKAVITEYGKRVMQNPLDYYFPDNAKAPANSFTILDDYYGLPAVESALSPYF